MFQIRRYQPSDYPAVWHLHNLGLQAMGAHLGSGPWDDDLHQIEEHYLKNGGEFLVGLLDHTVVALGAFRKQAADRVEIKRLRVHPSYWRRGFGQHLLTALEQQARAQGYRLVQLDTTINQQPAQQLFVKNGYQEYARKSVRGIEIIYYKKALELAED